MSAIRNSPLIPQHAPIRGLANAVPLKRSRRGLKNLALLCLGPLCLLLIYFYNGSRASETTGNIPGGAAVEQIVRKGRQGYEAAKAAAIPAPRERLRMKQEEEEEQSQSWRDSLVDRFFAGSEDEEQPRVREKVEIKPHNYMDNGLVAVNPQGRHPIFDLLTRSQEAWRQKTSKQSTTLWQATKEYRKRYQRPPPKGFDQWWQYVRNNNVQLPDEYDQINRDLEPFRGMKPAYLHSLQPEWENSPGTYVLECNAPNKPGCHVAKKTFDTAEDERVGLERAHEQLGLLKDIEEFLPHMRVTFSGHDGPAQMVGHEYRSSLEDAAEMGEFINPHEHEHDLAHKGWASACAPHKPIHNSHDPDLLPTQQSFFKRDKSFIWDHKASMDPCIHPELTQITGFLAGYGKGPRPQRDLYPILAMCSTPLHSDVLTVAMEAFTEEVGNDPPWEQKTDSRLLWRGSTTGILFKDGLAWNISQRIRLVEQASSKEGTIALLPSAASPDTPIGKPESTPISLLNELLLDIGFVGEPIQCADKHICDELSQMFEFKERQGWDKANNYKYIYDIDGNGWSARFKRLMSTNSLILKTTVFPEWYQDRIQAWVHYVPIKVDLSDLYDTMLFFKGDAESGHNGHDDLAREIAIAGKRWSQTFWRREDLIAYQFRLFLEYARLMSTDQSDVHYDA